MPEPISNNAQTEGILDGKIYIYTFAGIDSTKQFDGIHLRSYRMDLENETWEALPDLPDDRGKIAASASTIGDTIYIVGGYYVFENGTEQSSNHIHRFVISENNFIEDGASIPVPIDDHVQFVYKNRYIYIITGWTDSGHVPDVQIYDTKNDTWMMGDPVPSNSAFMVFGGSGEVIGDTIYYLGGAGPGGNFLPSPNLRKGAINPNNISEIVWTRDIVDQSPYRAACVRTEEYIHWLGGSDKTYNYNGLAYTNNQGVPPNYKAISAFESSVLEDLEPITAALPMDLRGAADIGNDCFIICGGMLEDQIVSDECLKACFEKPSSTNPTAFTHSFKLINNIINEELRLFSDTPSEIDKIEIYSMDGQYIQGIQQFRNVMNLSEMTSGMYIIRVLFNNSHYLTDKFIKN